MYDFIITLRMQIYGTTYLKSNHIHSLNERETLTRKTLTRNMTRKTETWQLYESVC